MPLDSGRGALPIHPSQVRDRVHVGAVGWTSGWLPSRWAGMGDTPYHPPQIHLTAHPAHLGNRKTGWFPCSGGLGFHPGSPRSTQPANHNGCPSQTLCLSLPDIPPMLGTLKVNPVFLQPQQRGSALGALLVCSSPQQTHDKAALTVAQRGQQAAPHHCWHGACTGHHCGSVESYAGGLQVPQAAQQLLLVTTRFCLLRQVWGAILQSKEEYVLVLKCPEETDGQGKGCAMKRVEQTEFLQSSRLLLASLQELRLISLSPTHCS